MERRRGENRLLCTCRASDHIQMPRSWPPCWLIGSFHSVSWREGKRRENEEEKERREERRKKKERREKERERESKKEKDEN